MKKGTQDGCVEDGPVHFSESITLRKYGTKKASPSYLRHLCHSIALTELNPPIFPSAAFALHQAEADQLAAQGGGVVVIALQNLIDLFLTITFVRFKSFDDVAQDRFEF